MKLGSLTLDNHLFLAPLAGITDTIFRVIAKRYGCGFVFSEMLNSNGVLKGGISLRQKLDISREEGMVGIQIAGDDPEIMAQAATIAQDAGAATININMGCPAPKVTKNQAGCALMKHPHLVGEILRAVRQKIDVPLTIKIRLGWDPLSMNYLEISKIAQEEGCVAVFIHARTRQDGFSGEAKLPHIRSLKNEVRIPIIGNGDITSAKKALTMMRETGCDGVMIGRGALGQPWIFRQILEAMSAEEKGVKTGEETYFKPPLLEIRDLMIEHLLRSVDRYGKTLGLKLMQKHFAWYSKGFSHSAEFRKNIHTKEDIPSTLSFIHAFIEKQGASLSLNSGANSA